MEREDRFRNKITWFSFIFSVMVVWVHSANWELFLGRTVVGEKVGMLERFVGNSIGQIAVPGFFMMSGYLFYRNFTWDILGRKWNSRIRSVLVPFVLWNGIYYLGYVIGSRLPVLTDILGKGKIPLDWYTAVEGVLHYSYNYVFWYLYQLILLILLAPILYGILKHRLPGAAALVVSFGFARSGMVIPHLNLDALFYYSLAAYGGIHGKHIVEGRRTGVKAAVGAILTVTAVMILIIRRIHGAGGRVWVRTLMPVGLWFLIDEERLPKTKRWMEYNFFLYAVHYALVRLINKTAARFLGSNWLPAVALFMFMPVFMVYFSCNVGGWLKSRFPRLWFLLNGGR